MARSLFLACLPLLLLPAALPLAAQAPVLEALAKGKASLELRTRYEHVEDQAFTAPADHKTANAFTNRTLLGLETGELFGVKANLQFASVTALGEERYNSGLNGRTQFASVQDPGLSTVLQAFVAWKGLKVGRQMLAVDNQRFIGAGAWAQLPKSYTGVTLQQNFGLKWFELHAGHLTRLQSSTGINKEMKAEFLRLRFQPWTFLAVTPFIFAVDETTAPATSHQHQGLRLDGKWSGLLYEASFARQRRYKDAKTTPERLYRQGSLGYGQKTWSIKAVHEELEGGFDTPLSSLHGFYGWSDRLAKTPAAGLVDQFIQGEMKRWGFTFEVQAHRFKAYAGSQAYGSELDVSVTHPITRNLTFLLKAADYRADAGAPASGSLNKDLRRFWLMTTFKY